MPRSHQSDPEILRHRCIAAVSSSRMNVGHCQSQKRCASHRTLLFGLDISDERARYQTSFEASEGVGGVFALFALFQVDASWFLVDIGGPPIAAFKACPEVKRCYSTNVV